MEYRLVLKQGVTLQCKNFKIDEIVPIENEPDMVYVWIRSRGYPVHKDEVEAFIEHYEKYSSIPYEAISREIYESFCKKFELGMFSDEEILKNSYGNTYGDFGMGHYFDPENRKSQLLYMLNQRRFWKLQETEKVEEVKKVESTKIEKQGQLWEPCSCGDEPIYLPLHLCQRCWPK